MMAIRTLRRVAGNARNRWYRRPRLALVSSAILREHRSMRLGIRTYHAHQEAGEHKFLLRRNIHMIEKGLTMQPRRATFAVEYIVPTVDALIFSAKSSEQTLDDAEATWMFSVLADYFAATSSSNNPSIERARSSFENFVGQESLGPLTRGPHAVELADSSVDIDELLNLAQKRRSVRWFQDRPVDRSAVDKAVAVAMESPTACNRQPYRFEILDDKESILQVGSIPMGTAGYADQLVGLVVVVGKLSAFFDERDRHLIYIDSSLATMSFIYGLESQGIASCVINWPDIAERELKIRRVLGLSQDEKVVMLVAYGYPREASLVPFSQKGNLAEARVFRAIAGPEGKKRKNNV